MQFAHAISLRFGLRLPPRPSWINKAHQKGLAVVLFAQLGGLGVLSFLFLGPLLFPPLRSIIYYRRIGAYSRGRLACAYVTEARLALVQLYCAQEYCSETFVV